MMNHNMMNQTNTVMPAVLIVAAIGALAVVGITTAIISSATPAHARVNSCPTSPGGRCFAGGSGQQGGGSGGHATCSDPGISHCLSVEKHSGGSGQQGGGSGGQFTFYPNGDTRCVGSRCP
jgi:hypothetical protein